MTIRRAGSLIALAAAGGMFMGSANAQVDVGQGFTSTGASGAIRNVSNLEFATGGSITGLANLQATGSIAASTLTIAGGTTVIDASGIKTNSISAGSTTLNDSGLTTGATTVSNDGVAVGNDVQLTSSGLTITGGPSVTSEGIDAGGKPISNVAVGTADNHAVNLGQLNAVATRANAGWNVSANGGASQNVAPGGSVSFNNGSNIVVTHSGTNLSFALAEDITVNSMNISGGPRITTDGIEVGGLKITGLAEGELAADSTEAVSGKQIYDLFIEEGAGGVRYFRARSAQPDSEALGDESIAIGPNTISAGESSLAAGDGATTTESGEAAIALGQGATAGGELAGGEAAIAIGRNSSSTGDGALAIGDEAQAGGANAMALGTGALAAGGNGVALGQGAVAGATNNISIGTSAGFNTGQIVPGDQSHNIAIGNSSGQNVAGQFNVAMGDGAGSEVDGDDNVAFGRGAGVGIDGEQNVSIGLGANAGQASNRAVAIGSGVSAQTEGVALGFSAQAGNTGVAVGRQSTAVGTGTAIGPNAHADANYVALGLNSWATQDDVSGSSFLTKRSFSGSAVSVGSSVAGSEFTRRIVNVEDGANATDAVNVRQLEAAIGGIDLSDIDFADGVIANLQEQIDQNMLSYVSVNDGGVDQGNKNNNGADAAAVDSIAIGPDATTKNQDSIAIGHMAGAEGDSAVVLGHNIKGLGANSTTIGNSQSEAHGESGIAIGTGVVSRDENSIVIGRDSYTNRQASGPSVENSIVIGTSSSSTAVEGIVIGKDSVVNAPRGIAQGSVAQATASDAMAFGTRAAASGASSQASGMDATAHRANGIATGTGATAWANDGIAMGSGAVSGFDDPANQEPRRNMSGIAIGQTALADNYHALALGVSASATDESATAIGDEAEASAEDALAVGSGAVANAQNAAAFGQGAQAQGQDSLAAGSGATTSGVNATAVGQGAIAQGAAALAVGSSAQATAENASAFGQGAQATHANSVALGAGSVTADANPTSSGTVEGITYGGFAGTNPQSVASVGSEGNERQIINVAAGRISDTSTDAINGSQLFATQTVIGNVANSTVEVLGGNATVGPDGTITMTNVGDTNYNTVHDAIGYAAQGWDVSAQGGAAENVAPGGAVDFSNEDGNIDIARTDGTTNLVFNLSDDITVNSLTAGDTIVDTTGVAVGDDVKLGDTGLTVQDDAGNTTTVEAGTISVADAGGNTTIGGTQINVGGTDGIVIDSETGTVAGLGNTTFDPNATYTGGQAATQEQLTQVNSDLATAGLNFVGDDTNVVHRDLGEQLSITGGATGNLTEGNIGVTRNAGEDGLVIQLAENINLGEDGSLATGATVINNDGVAVGDNVALSDTGLTIGDTTIGGTQINVGGGSPILIDGDAGTIGGLSNTTFDPTVTYTGGQAATQEQLSQVYGVANAGWDISANGLNSTQVSPSSPTGRAVDLNNADGNIVITKAGDSNDVTFDLAQNINLGTDGSLTTGATVINNDGVAVGDNVALTDTALTIQDADGNSTVTNAAGTTVTGSTGTTNVGAGSITVEDDTGNETTIGGTQVVVGGGNQITLDGETGTIGGLTNTTWNPEGPIVSGQAATEDQLLAVSDTAYAGWNLSGSGEDQVNIGPNGNVDFQGDDNITVAQTGDDQDGVIAISLNDTITLGDGDNAITIDGSDGSITTGETSIDGSGVGVGNDVHLGNTGLVIQNGPSVTVAGIDAGNLNITNVLAGTEDHHAVNYGQLRPITEFVGLGDDGSFTYNGTQHATLTDVLDSMHWVVEAPVPGESGSDGDGGTGGNNDSGGTGGSGGSGNGTPIHNTNVLGFVEGDNVVISKSERVDANGNTVGADVKVALAQDISVNSITAVQVDAQSVTANQIAINNGGPIINEKGIDMSDNRITNLAPGVEGTDAVNVDQLNTATGNLQGQVNNLQHDLRRQDKKLSAGVAAAMATAALPQAYLPGKTMMGLAAGGWNSESGMAIGFSGISDNGHWIYKLSGNATSRGDYGGAVGVGYQW